MTKERLQQLSVDELTILARKEDIDIADCEGKDDIIDCILEVFDEIEEERKENNPTVNIEGKKYIIAHDEELDLKSIDEVSIPSTYKKTRIVLLVRDPYWAYTYWEISDEDLARVRAEQGFDGLLLRIHDIKNVDFKGDNANYSIDIPVTAADSSWYINIPNPDSVYCIDFLYSAGGTQKLIARSNKAVVPREGFSDMRDEQWNAQGTDAIIEMIMSDFEYFLPASGMIPQRIISFVSSSFIPYMKNK